ncbi:MAG: hypothetical protein WC220_10785 [Pedobacter sp.]|jgi:hypothetical protein
MKNLQITKRDVKIFFLGMLFGFLVVLIYEWDDAMDGLKGGYESLRVENIN